VITWQEAFVNSLNVFTWKRCGIPRGTLVSIVGNRLRIEFGTV